MNRETRGQNNVDLPQQFGEYQLVERLAVGGMAEIYRAKTTGIGGFEKVLVIKKLHDRLSRDDEFIEMIVDEAKIAVRLKHPNIAKIFDLGRLNNQYFIAMEYIEGPDLSRVMSRASQQGDLLPIPAVLFVGAEACSGLHYAHTRRDANGQPMQIVHRDVSPPNIMLSVEGEVKIVDFGIAKARKRIQKTRNGIIKGKFHYMAPEQAHGDRVDARTDVFSIGMVVYEMLTGENPHDGVGDQKLLDAVRQAQIPPIRHHRPTVDPELDQLVMRAIERNPDNRYRSAEQFDQALTDYRERKCEPYDRRRLSSLVRNLWASLQQEGQAVARPQDETGAMSADDFEADNSSVIYDVEEGRAVNQEAEFVPDTGGDANPFDEEAPTQIWDGGDPGGTEAPTSDDLPPQAPAPGGVLGGDGGGSPAAARDHEGTAAETPRPRFEESGGGSPKVEATPQRPSDEEKTDQSRASQRPGLDTVVEKLEEAGIDRRVQAYVGIALGMMVITGLGLGVVALFSGGEPQNIAKKKRAATPGPNEGGSASSVDVKVQSDPSGATVRIDGDDEGETPVTLESLEIGKKYELEVEREGYKSEVRTFTPASGTGSISVKLTKANGVLRISTYPSDAEIELDGETVGYSPVTVTKLERGREHDLEAHLEGQTVEKTVTWDDGDDAVKEVRLRFEDVETEEEDDESREYHARRSDRRERRRRNYDPDPDPEPSGGGGGGGTSGSSSSSGSNPDLIPSSDPSGSSNSQSSASSRGSSSNSSGGGSGEGTNLDIWNLENSGPGASATGSKGSSSQGQESGKGFLSVQVKKGWGKVYVDDEMVASETPLVNYALEPGTHRVKVYYPVLKRYSKERTVTVEPGKTARAIFNP